MRCHRAPSLHVDHITPLARGGTNARRNLQALCGPCHSTKTARQDGGFGRVRQVSPNEDARRGEGGLASLGGRFRIPSRALRDTPSKVGRGG